MNTTVNRKNPPRRRPVDPTKHFKNAKFVLPRIKMPSGGSTTFEMPYGEHLQEFEGVILCDQSFKVYYEEAYSGKKVPPDCSSSDGVNGYTKAGKRQSCAFCPYNQFGSGKKSGKACSDKLNLYILIEGRDTPIIYTLPPTSLGEYGEYLSLLFAKDLNCFDAITKFTLTTDKNSTGIKYSKAKFEFVSITDDEKVNRIETLVDKWKMFAASISMGEILHDEAITSSNSHDLANSIKISIDPETGEVVDDKSDKVQTIEYKAVETSNPSKIITPEPDSKTPETSEENEEYPF